MNDMTILILLTIAICIFTRTKWISDIDAQRVINNFLFCVLIMVAMGGTNVYGMGDPTILIGAICIFVSHLFIAKN